MSERGKHSDIVLKLATNTADANRVSNCLREQRKVGGFCIIWAV
jgi:hypothetical protein